ncbi:MAG: hypothetical protein LBP68_02190 [Acidobacteriota bacterium]|jgi:hypothetical protein|nr:hypothetical protein [Acidobacteriota bacterium]
MLEFHSASVRSVNSKRAADECVEVAFPDGVPGDCRVVIFNATLGHRLDKVADAIRQSVPLAALCGASGCAVTGREGVGESMHELGIMAVCGPENEVAVASVTDICSRNSYEKGVELAKALKERCGNANLVYLLCSGIDIDNALVLQAFDEVFGREVTIFGGTSSDNMRGLYSFQYHDGVLDEHGAFAVGFADATLHSVTRATHGFSAYGDPLVATKTEGNLIYEFGGNGAWSEYTRRISQPVTATCGDTIPVGALAEELPPELAEEYGNPHILRVITKHDGEVLYYPVTCKEGLKVWVTMRDEALIFSEQRRTLDYLKAEIGAGKPVAVLQTDCLARGRFIFNRVMKDEIIGMMQTALSVDGVVPAWLGNYGFGEYARLGGVNTYHNYSTALLVLYRL